MRIFSQKIRQLIWIMLGLLGIGLFLSSCKNHRANDVENKDEKYIVGVLLAYDSPTSNEVLRAFQEKLKEYQQKRGEQVEIIVKRAGGQLWLLPEMVKELVARCQILVPVSTPALQAALISTENTPVVFSSVANPFLLRAGRTAVDHDPRVTGVCSTAPVRQVLELVKQALPGVRKIGTIWTPSEINSEYYLGLMMEAASELNLEIKSQPITGAQDLVQAVQSLLREKIEVLCPVSDNTINANFELLGRLAEENRLPLFASFALGAELGACASLGFSFDEIGRKTAELVLRIKNGESPARIPFQYVDRIRLYLNEHAAEKQGVIFPDGLKKKADRIIRIEADRNNTTSSGIRSEG
jgi:ABC-type uncharacterized transport system substrate-binding protein